MERLLEFISANLGLVIFVAGIALTFLARLRKEGGNGQNGRRRPKSNPMMPSFGGDSSRTDRRWPAPSYPQPETSAPAERPQARPAERADGRTDLTAPLSVAASGMGDSPVSGTGRGPSAAPGEGIEPELSPSEAMRGMMWAEILGPPRAKKPFGAKNR
ncbi:MAG: hypothetical protein K0Q94_575 [Paenibacillus sp.]|jgi:hypothetical protein|uniref:hypothetical protein n=1 Tax=Paenibacillus sp. GCM10012303 TaxID=3317340 RepID=UPI0029EE9E78|nr:hypothetical protein [Paenibacillus sp.]